MVENEDFLVQNQHLRNLDKYKIYLLQGEDVILREILGKPGRRVEGLLLYGEFEEDQHMSIDIPPPDYDIYPDAMILVGMDFGFYPAILLSYVEQGQMRFFKEIIIEDINFFDLLKYHFIPYLEEHLEEYYRRDQIVIIGDPTSGGRRDAIKSTTPVNVLM